MLDMARRTDVRLACFGAAALLAVYIGFIAVPVQTAEELVKRGGYYVIAGTVALFLQALWRLRAAAPLFSERLSGGQKAAVVGSIAVFSLLAFNAEPYQSKILYDEFVLQSTAFNMHYFRDVAMMVRGYDINGVFVSTDNYLDKRPYLYPFLVSLVHDVTGYRMANAYVLNTILLPLALALAFTFGRMLSGWRGGLLAVLLLGTLPLLGQNATGSGMELTNTVMILASLVLGAAWLFDPGERRLAAFLVAVVLLAQSRYESALYVLAAVFVVAAGWWRRREISVPWIAVLVPLLLLPVALQNKFVSNTPVMWELKETRPSRFDLGYVADNVEGAISYLFSRSAERSNSLLLSILGLLGLAWLLVLLGRYWRRASVASPARIALACFGAAVLANTFLVLCYYWARFDDPMASRFSLPLHLLLTFAVVLLAADLDRWLPATRGLWLAVGSFSLVTATAKFSYHYYSHMGVEEIEWQRRYVSRLPPGDRLIVTGGSSVPWLLEKKPAILIGRAQLVADRLQYQLDVRGFHEILVIQSLRPSTIDGDHQVIPDDKLPPGFKLEMLAEKRFGTRFSRISRLLAVDLPVEARSAADSAGGGIGSGQ
jgi:hypothetical protein